MRARVVNNKTVMSSMRFDGSFHNADANVYDEILKRHSSFNLGHYCSKIFTSGRNRRIYTNEAFGTPFLSNTDVMSANPFLTCKYTSKKYGFDVDGLLKTGMILTGRVGAIGQTAYVPQFWEDKKAIGSDNIIRIEVKPENKSGFIYAYLASKVGISSFWKHATGGVQPFITDKMVGGLPIPDFPEVFQGKVDTLIKESSSLRGAAYSLLVDAERLLKRSASLDDLSPDDYDYFGPRDENRQLSAGRVSIKEIGTVSFNAFCHSKRLNQLKNIIPHSVCIKDVLISGDTFSTGSFPRVEVKEGKGVMLINQSDIFDTIIKGKWISKRKVNYSNNLVSYGEVIVAGVGTLGESELFCRALFANEDLEGQLISGEFIRMKCNEKMPSGYLFTWLNSDYGFRLIRSTHSGTKLCRPIPTLFLQIPVPVIDREKMDEIDLMVRTAFTKRHQANNLEKEAIQMVENEIDKWNKN